MQYMDIIKLEIKSLVTKYYMEGYDYFEEMRNFASEI